VPLLAVLNPVRRTSRKNGSCCKNPSRCRHNNPILSGVVAGVAAGVSGAVANKFLKNSGAAITGGTAPDGTVYKVRRKASTGEWMVVAYVGGKRHEGKTYYTTSKSDALGTFDFLMGRRRDPGMNPSKSVRTYRVPPGLERQIVSTLSNLFVWARALDGQVMTLAKPDLMRKVIAHVQKGGRKNPLSRGETAQIVSRARDVARSARRAKQFGRDEDMKKYLAYGRGLLSSAHSFAPRSARRAVRKMEQRLHRIAPRESSRMNPSAAQTEITVPFRAGRKYSVAQIQNWVEKHGTPSMKKRFAQAMAQYRRFHKGSMPKFITYSLYKMGSHPGVSDVEFGVSEGREWMAAYQVPRTSGKWMDKASAGRYVHAHGDIEVDIKRPVKLSKLPVRFHTPDGKAVGVIPSKNVKIGEWYEG
jgi:hypothetical protein